jgi:hypothetical protein
MYMYIYVYFSLLGHAYYMDGDGNMIECQTTGLDCAYGAISHLAQLQHGGEMKSVKEIRNETAQAIESNGANFAKTQSAEAFIWEEKPEVAYQLTFVAGLKKEYIKNNGEFVYERDKDGNIKYEKDKYGNDKVDENGHKIKMKAYKLILEDGDTEEMVKQIKREGRKGGQEYDDNFKVTNFGFIHCHTYIQQYIIPYSCF